MFYNCIRNIQRKIALINLTVDKKITNVLPLQVASFGERAQMRQLATAFGENSSSKLHCMAGKQVDTYR